MATSQDILSIMIAAAEQSALLIRDNFRKTDSYQDKSSHLDIVTETDVASQQIIHDVLVAGMKRLGVDNDGVGFVQEESGSDQLKEHNFIVDPIDGTTNYSSGIPFSCISIGYAVKRKLTLGVVLEPFSNTLYWGEVGKGAFAKDLLLGERQLSLQLKPETSWIVGAHLNSIDVVDSQFLTYQNIYPHVRGLRNIGSLTLDLCFMADNVIDVVFNKGSYLWDVAAASVLLGEAGGMLYDLQGDTLEIDWEDTKKKYQLFACHPANKDTVLAYL